MTEDDLISNWWLVDGRKSKTAKFEWINTASFGGDEVTQGVGRVIAADAIVIRIHFEDILRTGGVMLERRQRLNEAGATGMEEEPGRDPGGRVAEALENFGPAIEAIRDGGAQVDAQVSVLAGNAEAVALAGEDVGPGGEAAEGEGITSANGEAMALEHGVDGVGVAFGHQVTRGVLVHDDDVAVVIPAAEQDDGVLVEAIVEGSEPFDGGVV